jgi:nicotinate-nucleotide--dimethylbenzimidazole phosphoribosyltransferase
MTAAWLRSVLGSLREPDAAATKAVEARAHNILRPPGALARLDDVAAWVAAWQGTSRPAVERPAALIFVGDHGVARRGVSAYSTDVTASMLEAFRQGVSTINAFGRVVGATVHAIDVGVGRPTGDIVAEPALSHERFDESIDAGRRAVDALDADLLVLGEMGIGNTTAASAVAVALVGGDVMLWVGRGTGVDDEGLQRKYEAVRGAFDRIAGITDPLEVLREVGGSELAAMAGAAVAARQRGIPVVLDGYVVAAAITPLAVARPGAVDHCLAGHCSAEHGHRRLLERLGLSPVLDLSLRLGEGSGAMAAVPIIAMACAGITEVPTFDEWARRG